MEVWIPMRRIYIVAEKLLGTSLRPFCMRVAVLALVYSLLLDGAIVPYRLQPGPDNSFVLEVEKTGLWSGRKHVFHFERYHGEIQYDPEKPENSHAHVVVEAPSAVCKDDWVKPADQKKVMAYALDD